MESVNSRVNCWRPWKITEIQEESPRLYSWVDVNLGYLDLHNVSDRVQPLGSPRSAVDTGWCGWLLTITPISLFDGPDIMF